MDIISLALQKWGKFGGIAQLARALGSYPSCPRFESRCRYQFPNGDSALPFGNFQHAPRSEMARWSNG